MVSSIPYPIFRVNDPVGEGRCALSAVGRCRIEPLSYDSKAKFQAILEKTRQQASVDLDETLDADQKKKDKKKYMKQGVAMTQDYLMDDLKLDVSIVDVDVVVSQMEVIETDGCIAACLLDAGCDRIVVTVNDEPESEIVAALDAAKVPSSRMVVHFSSSNAGLFGAVKPFCECISVEVAVPSLEVISEIASTCKATGVKATVAYESSTDGNNEMVRNCCKKFPEAALTLGMVNPTAEQLGQAYAACLVTDRPDGLFTTVVSTRSGVALGLVYSSTESVVAALACGRGVYYSRSRNGLWRKGDTSGHYQTLHRLDFDCDGDALRFTVTQRGDDHKAFCHLNTLTCWGPPRGLDHLQETLEDRMKNAPSGSYTKRLFDDNQLLRDKLVEEAQELSEADTKTHVAEELADVLYFSMVRAVKAGVSLDEAVAELDRRSRKVTRRKGDSKAFRIAAGDAILNKNDS